MLSIVVPCHGTEEYLDDCLTSLRRQDYPNIEIVVVDDGSPDKCASIARAHMRRDLRVRLVRRPTGGISAARNTGIEHARGEYLTFVDSDDEVVGDAYARVIETLRSSGSDFAVSLYERLDLGRRAPAAGWVRRCHERRRLATTLDAYPDVMVNAVAWSKVYRRSFWDEAGLRFPEGHIYEDQPASAAAFVKAHAFDVLPEVTVLWRIRHDQLSITQQASSRKNMLGHNQAVDMSLDVLLGAGNKDAAMARSVQLLANNMYSFVRHVLTTRDERFWSYLREGVMRLLLLAEGDDYLRQVPAQYKILYHLVVANRRDDVETFLEQFGTDVHRFPSTLHEDGARAVLPFSLSVPADCSLLSDNQTQLFVEIVTMQWQSRRLRISGWAMIHNVDLSDHSPHVRFAFVRAGAHPIPLTVTTHVEPRADDLGRHQWADYRPGGFIAELDVSDLPTEGNEWLVVAEVVVGALSRETTVRDISSVASASVGRAHTCEDGTSYTMKAGKSGALVLRVAHRAVYALTHDVDDRGRLSVSFKAPSASAVVLGAARSSGRALLAVKPERTGAGTWHVEMDLHQLPPPELEWPKSIRVSVVTGSGERTLHMLAAPGTPTPLVGQSPREGWSIRANRDGALELSSAWVVAATDVRSDGDHVTVRCVSVKDLAGWTPVLRAFDHEVAGTCTSVGDGVFDLSVSLTRCVWGRTGVALSRRVYGLVLQRGEKRQPVVVQTGLFSSLPIDLPTARHHLRVQTLTNKPTHLAVSVRSSLTDEERGSRNQRRLREGARVPHADDDSVFFRSMYGEAANCNMLGVHQELVRRESPLRLLWSVKDYSVPVPDGGLPVMEGSRAWHEAIARSRYHLVNTHQPDWFAKPQGQVLIQTMHGYPYKTMGHRWWEERRFSGIQVRSFDRRAREWDYLVSPATYATRLLREEFLDPAGSTAEILEIGYPRNDILQSSEADGIRLAVRELLGIHHGQTAILYAPTFRDYLSADDRSLQGVGFFDVSEATRRLGDRFVFLMRGHVSHGRAKERSSHLANIIDVTTYPDVNDLILASDAAVLDYSSLRFDYSVTGKPMIFLIPDRARYDAIRGGMLPFERTAPGPTVGTTREVIAQIRDLPALRSRYAETVATFRSRYVDLEDGFASRRLVDAVFVPRGDASASGDPSSRADHRSTP